MKKYIKILNITLLLILFFFMTMYGIAYIMKDRANNENSRKICKQVYEGPKNIINLISKKFLRKEIIGNVNINKILKEQEKIDKQIEKEYSELEYTWKCPYIKVNPYGTTPLSTLIKFKTDEPMRVKIEIVDREGTNIEYIFEEYKEEHEYRISGLYIKGQSELLLTFKTQDGKEKNKKLKIKANYNIKNPIDFYININKLKYIQLFLLRRDEESLIIDNFGNIRGIRISKGAFYYLPLLNNKYLNSITASNELIIEDEIGKILKAYKLGKYKYHHHGFEMENGNLLLAVSKIGTEKINIDNKKIETNQDYIVELDRETGKIIKEWDIGSILDVNRLYQGRGKGPDWFHMNSFVYDKKDNSLIISGNHQGVVKIDYETGKLKWIMAYHKEWGKAGRDGKGEDLNKYLLYATDKTGNRYSDDIQNGEKIIEEFKFPVGQHDLSIVGENQILMFDNKRLNAPVYKNNQNDIYSRAVIYEIDEMNMNVKETWSFGKELGQDMYSSVVSSAEENDETILIGAGTTVSKNLTPRSKIVEVDKKTKEVLLDITVSHSFSGWQRLYQVNRIK